MENMENLFNKLLAKQMQEGSAMLIHRNMKGFKLLRKAQEIILNDKRPDILHFSRPYISTTQNQRYLEHTVADNIQKACIILGPGDTLFELARRNIPEITAVERNDLQVAVFELRRASMLTLSHSEYENFLLDKDNKDFLSKDVFKYVKDAFIENALEEKGFWEKFLQIHPKEDILQYYIKGGMEQSTLDVIRNSIPYIKKKGLYAQAKKYLEIAKITIIVSDVIEYLENNSEEKFDYIDITNILLLAYQIECKSDPVLFDKLLERIKKIYSTNLNENGTFVLDYMFGYGIDDLKSSEIADSPAIATKIYKQIYNELQKYFTLEMFEENAMDISVVGLNGSRDTIVYTKNKL